MLSGSWLYQVPESDSEGFPLCRALRRDHHSRHVTRPMFGGGCRPIPLIWPSHNDPQKDSRNPFSKTVGLWPSTILSWYRVLERLKSQNVCVSGPRLSRPGTGSWSELPTSSQHRPKIVPKSFQKVRRSDQEGIKKGSRRDQEGIKRGSRRDEEGI